LRTASALDVKELMDEMKADKSNLALIVTAAVLILVPYALFSYSLPIQRDSGVRLTMWLAMGSSWNGVRRLTL
jgi:hypothetical protein